MIVTEGHRDKGTEQGRLAVRVFDRSGVQTETDGGRGEAELAACAWSLADKATGNKVSVRSLSLCSFVALSLAALLGGMAEAQTLEQAVVILADRLTEVPDIRGQEVAVGDFEQGRGQYSELSNHLTDLLEVALVNKQSALGFTVIRREMRTDATKEMRFGLSDVASLQQRQQFGELLRATALAAGSITDRQTHVSLIARLVDLTSTRVLSAYATTVQKDAGIRAMMARLLAPPPPPPNPGPGPQPPSVVFPGVAAGDPQLRIRVWTDRQSYRVGETIRFHFMANRNAYVTLVDHGTSGRSTLLFPNAYSGINFVQGGVTYSIPGQGDAFEFRIQPPPGQELVRMVATDTPWSPSLAAPRGGGTIFRSLDPAEGRVLTRDIAVMQKQTPATQRADEIIRIEVLP